MGASAATADDSENLAPKYAELVALNPNYFLVERKLHDEQIAGLFMRLKLLSYLDAKKSYAQWYGTAYPANQK